MYEIIKLIKVLDIIKGPPPITSSSFPLNDLLLIKTVIHVEWME